ncbi:MAG: nitrogenase molybdenum-iron protein subunit beta [Candidatus Bathyarchaeota archaeon]|nr:nitrogenase molybdenum-iron protein subunit beta [Candidatus Bathyarchaeota archaeon]
MVVITKTRSVAINAPKMCQPIGAIWATLGVHGSVPLVHGSQGCSTYPRNLMGRHFREPIEVAITSLHEKATIFGGASNLKQALANIIIRQQPELITVITTCLSETTGDDIHGIVKAFRAEKPELAKQSKIVTVNTPSYVGTHVVGYDNAVKAMVSQLSTGKDRPSDKVNVIPGIINPGDVMELKHIFSEMGVPAIYITDISQTLNAPLRLPKPHFPRGGTTVEEIADCANSLGTIAVCKHQGQGAVNYLKDKFSVPGQLCETPIGVEATEDFLEHITRFTGKKVPESLLDERDLLVDAMVDSSHITFGTKVAIFGDPDVAFALARFTYELGMQPIHVMTTLETPKFAPDMKALATDYGTGEDQNNLIVGGDLYELHQKIKEKPVDLLIGDYKGKYIAKEEHIPLVRVGFPQADRFGYQRRAMLGFRGSLQLLDTLVNTVMDTKD